MNTSSYLEAFLSVYGWMMYNVFYDLFAMLWLIFLPFLRVGYTTLIDTIADAGDRQAQFKKGIIAFVSMIFLMFMALVPLNAIQIKDSTINSVCVPKGQTIKIENGELKDKFKLNTSESAKVPLLPSLAMRFASGTNNVIYNAIPCTASVNNFVGVVRTSEINNPALSEELLRFENECAMPAEMRFRELESKAPKTFDKMLREFKKQDSPEGVNKMSAYTDHKERRYFNSSFYKFMLDPSMDKVILGDPSEKAIVEEIVTRGTGKGDTLYSADRVTGVTSDNEDASAKQKSDNSAPIKCIDWWNNTLYPQIFENVNENFARKVGQDDYFKYQCYNIDQIQTDSFGGTEKTFKKDSCDAALSNAAQDEKYKDEVVYRAIIHDNQANLLNREDRAAATGIATLSIIGTILSFFTSKADVLSSIAANAASFYAQMFFYRVVIQLLQPMLLMGIFCFWGVYMILSGYRWETVFKGLVLIYIVSVMPGLWAITQHLDNSLWAALHPDVKGLSAAAKATMNNTVERILLDAASTVFNVIFPLLLMYIVTEAGMGNPTAGINSTSKGADQISKTTARGVGSSTGAIRTTAGSLKDRITKLRAGRLDKNNLPPGGSRY